MAFRKIFFVLILAGLFVNQSYGRTSDNVIATSKSALAMEIKSSNALRAGGAFMATLYSHIDTEAEFVFTNAQGEVVRSVRKSLDEGATFFKFNLGDLPAGLYFLSVQTGDQQTKKAIIIQ